MVERQHLLRCKSPRELDGKKPKVYGKGRRCRCGAVLNQYTPGEWCNLCDRDPGRRARYVDLDLPERVMEPEKMSSKQAAEHLGVHVRDLKQLVADGSITVLKKGGGLWGTSYYAESVRDYKGHPDALKVLSDRVRDSFSSPKSAAIQESTKSLDHGAAHRVAVAGGDAGEISDALEGMPAICNGGGPCEDPEGCSAGRCRILPPGESNAIQDAVDSDPDYDQAALEIPVFDLEIEAMYGIRDALASLDRDAQLRVVRWALSKFALDAPLP